MTECIECGGAIERDDPVVGEVVDCRDCGLELEVRGLTPILLAAAPQEAEDWGE